MNPKAQETLNRIKKLIKDIFNLVNTFPKSAGAYKVSGQIIDSSTSIGANFVEAQSARSKKEFISTIGVVLKHYRCCTKRNKRDYILVGNYTRIKLDYEGKYC